MPKKLYTIDVGRTVKSKQIFIACPPSRYDYADVPPSGTRKHILTFSDDDVRWLIKALQRELNGQTR